MSEAKQQSQIFPLFNKGVVSKLDPALLTNGQLLSASNIVSLTEGSIQPRFGTEVLGTMAGGALAPHTVAKLSLSNQTFAISGATNPAHPAPIVITTDNPHGWQTGFLVAILGVNGQTAANSPTGSPWTITVTGPTTFSLNGSLGSGAYTNGGQATLASGDPSIRYIGEGGNIWRTLNNYATFTKVAQNVMGSSDPFTRWSEISYSAGSTGNPFAYFACPGLMLKDQGNAPFSTLESWGISPGPGAAAAISAAATYQTITAVTAGGGPYSLMYELTVPGHGFSTGNTVVVSGMVNEDSTSSAANGTWTIIVVDANDFILNNSAISGTSPYLADSGVVTLAGPDSTQQGATPYDYVYCYRDIGTGNEGNPSPFMQPALAVQSQNGSITVTVWGSPDPKISTTSGAQSISVYRRGGSYSDGLFRFVGYVTNPGVDGTGEPQSATLTDANADINLLYAAQVEFDNDPPVTSALRFPISATLASGGPFAPGWNTVTLSQAIVGILTIGTEVIVGPTSNQETCVIAALPYESTGANTTCLLYFQQNHADGEPALIDSVSGQPCSVGISAFDQIYLAGDANNPNTLYQSKSGMPESFPTIDALGNAHTLLVGSPSNAIMNLTEFRGNILCLNQTSLSEVSVYQGVMAGPYDTPAERGLIARWGFVNTGYLVFYLANDGIYSWDGSQSRKRTEAIDPAFHGVTIGGAIPINPISYVPSDLAYARMEYYRNQLYFLYSSGSGLTNMNVLRYDVLYDRWEPELYYDGTGPLSEIFLEKDTNAFIFARYNNAGNTISQNDQFGASGSTDEFTSGTGVNGEPILMRFQTAFFRLEGQDASRIKLVQDVFLELSNQDEVSVLVYYDYSSQPDPIDRFTIPASPATGGGISNVTSNGGLIQITAAANGLISGNRVVIANVLGVPANGEWTVTVVDANNFTLNGSVFSGAYISGGGYTLIQRRQVTLPLQLSGTPAISSGKEAFSVSVLVLCNSTHFNTFYALGFRFFDRDAIQQGITTDWMTLGSNNDKRLYQMHIEHNTNSQNVTVQMDIRWGVNGVNQANNVASFVLNSNEKTTVTLPIPEAGFPNQLTICKSVRLRPIYTPNSNFRIFMKPSFDSETLPPDVVLFTPWKDMGYPYEKIARNLIVDLDTGNVPCAIKLQADGGNIQTFTVTTTANDRKRYLPLTSGPGQAPQPIGRIFRLVTVPGTNGKSQIFDWSLDFIKEPGIVCTWDSYEQGFGSLGFKLIKQIWLFYLSPYPVNFAILTDGGANFYTVELPAHPTRAVERFYVPDATGTGPYVLNKSKSYRFQLNAVGATETGTNGLKFYEDESGVEFCLTSAGQRAAYQKLSLTEIMKLRA